MSMFSDEEFPSGEFPELSAEVVAELHRKASHYHSHYLTPWNPVGGILEGH